MYKINLLIMATLIAQPLFSQQINVINEEFDSEDALAHWQSHHESEGWPSFTSEVFVDTEHSALTIIPESSGWFGEFHRGPFYSQLVSGDFTIITRVMATGKSSPSPERSYSLAGLMLRSPRPAAADKFEKGLENWMFLSTGSATKKGKPQFESKNTVKGKSKLKVFDARTGWIELAISRVGTTFYQTYRYDGQSEWVLLRVIHHDLMGSELQAGILAYTDFWPVARKYFLNARKFNTEPVAGKPDLKAAFDYVIFLANAGEKLQYKEGFHNSELSAMDVKKLGLTD